MCLLPANVHALRELFCEGRVVTGAGSSSSKLKSGKYYGVENDVRVPEGGVMPAKPKTRKTKKRVFDDPTVMVALIGTLGTVMVAIISACGTVFAALTQTAQASLNQFTMTPVPLRTFTSTPLAAAIPSARVSGTPPTHGPNATSTPSRTPLAATLTPLPSTSSLTIIATGTLPPTKTPLYPSIAATGFAMTVITMVIIGTITLLTMILLRQKE